MTITNRTFKNYLPLVGMSTQSTNKNTLIKPARNTTNPTNLYGKRIKLENYNENLPEGHHVRSEEEKIFLKKLLLLLQDVTPFLESLFPSDFNFPSDFKTMKEEETVAVAIKKNFCTVPKLPDNRIYFKKRDVILIKQMARHKVSMEKQKYYIDITEACVGQNNKMRNEALQTLTLDKELYLILPQLCSFIMDGVKLNVIENSLTILIYLMRMLKAILDNKHIYLDKYLHQLIPSAITCVVSKDLGARREYDYHWYLRDFASRLMAQICDTFHRSTNNIRPRLYKLFDDALSKGNDLPLTSLYGVLAGLHELGEEAVRLVILPHIKTIAARIDIKSRKVLFTDNDKACDRIRELLIKALVPIILSSKKPDSPDEYKMLYGSLGDDLYKATLQIRNVNISMANACSIAVSSCNHIPGGYIHINNLVSNQLLSRRPSEGGYRNVVIHNVPNVSNSSTTINVITSNTSVNELLLSQKKK